MEGYRLRTINLQGFNVTWKSATSLFLDLELTLEGDRFTVAGIICVGDDCNIVFLEQI